MKTAPTLSLILAVTLLGTPSHADDSTTLIELCEQYLALPKNGEVNAEFIQLKSSCAGYINSHVKMSKPEDGFCIPKGYNMDDLATVYIDWVKKNPARTVETTMVTMTAALTEKYPCTK